MSEKLHIILWWNDFGQWSDLFPEKNGFKKRGQSKRYSTLATKVSSHHKDLQEKCGSAINMILISVKNSWRKIQMTEANFLQERNCFMAATRAYLQPIMQELAPARRTCGICHKKHPTSLHGYTPKQKTGESLDKNGKGDNENATASLNNCAHIEDVSCITTCSGGVISMCVVPIQSSQFDACDCICTCTCQHMHH